MNNFKSITQKLHRFTKKYYVNELIKGSILFFSLGFLYFIFTLFIEYFLWLKPTARTLLFWLFIIVELFLLLRFILIPIFKLIGIRKGITLEQCSKIIGAYFPEVNDKLLNVLQLQNNTIQSELLLASIHQKCLELETVPFVNAINFSKNKKYLKFAFIPIFIYITTLLSGFSVFSESLERVVNHKVTYTPPAPFSFQIQNKSLHVIQGKSITVSVHMVGSLLPSEAKIVFNNEAYFLENNRNGFFSYTFKDIQNNTQFIISANGFQSKEYQISVIQTPTIDAILLDLEYPKYLNKKNQTIQNTSNLLIPEGTTITWNVDTQQTNEVVFKYNQKRILFDKVSDHKFLFSKRILNPLNYQITSSNVHLKDFENLEYTVDILKDEFPKISVQSNLDSISRSGTLFAGKLSDDYGIKSLNLVYYDKQYPDVFKSYSLPITKATIQTFFYQFPEGLHLKEAVNYEFFFEVADNDAVNGSKKVKSKIFNFRQKSVRELNEELLDEQKATLHKLENSLQKQQLQQQALDKIHQEFQHKKKINWSDKKKIDNFIKRQENYKIMMQRQTTKLQENLEEQKETNPTLKQKKEVLKQRLEELKKLDKQQKLLAEIAKMSEKLNKENLLKKTKELAQQNKQQQRSLERILELTKRFYIAQKANQISDNVAKLSKKQNALEQQDKSSLKKQQDLRKEFDKIKEALDELSEDNKNLKDPMDLPDVEEEKEAIDKELNNIEENLEKDNFNTAKKNQKNSAKKMQQMSSKINMAMQAMEGDSMEENIDDLRKILENLVTFSFKQEALMQSFENISTTHPSFGKSLKKQNHIRTYFEHIDDSLYTLSMRLPKLSTKIQDDLSAVHYNLSASLENFSENRFSIGVSNQRYVMTATNNLSDYLSSMLNNMQNSMSMKMGKGKKKGKQGGFSLPDIIKKQEALSKKMKDGMKKGNQPSSKKENGKDGLNSSDSGSKENKGKQRNQQENNSEDNDLDGELYEIYKEQSRLREALQNAMKQSKIGSSKAFDNAKKVLKSMEFLESQLLEKGFNEDVLNKMQQLNYEFLKLDKASLEQGLESKKQSSTNQKKFTTKQVKELLFKKQFYNQFEILNRQSLPLQQNFKLKVRKYFSEQE